MIVRTVLVIAILAGATAVAAAASRSGGDAACRPDVRRLCGTVRQGAGDNAFLSCLQAHRSQLSARCRRVLDESGQ